jgi:hypothetical protein
MQYFLARKRARQLSKALYFALATAIDDKRALRTKMSCLHKNKPNPMTLHLKLNVCKIKLTSNAENGDENELGYSIEGRHYSAESTKKSVGVVGLSPEIRSYTSTAGKHAKRCLHAYAQ